MIKSILSVFSALLIVVSSLAQSTTNKCQSAPYKQFNFWVGEWEVLDTNSNVIGHNSILKKENNCLIHENWKSTKGFTGESFNYFDSSDSTWNQLWIGQQGNILKLKGKYNDNLKSMVLSDKHSNPNGNIINEITWTKTEKGNVIQTWKTFNTLEKKEQIIFKGIYQRVKL